MQQEKAMKTQKVVSAAGVKERGSGAAMMQWLGGKVLRIDRNML